MSGQHLIFWDFHGTLSARSWTGACQEVLTASGVASPDTSAIRAALQGGFPWHRHEHPHDHDGSSAAWWGRILPFMERALVAGGAPAARAGAWAERARHAYCDPSHYEVYDDVLPVLTALKGAGWRHVILSNHVPELPTIVDALPFGALIDEVLTSGTLGWEKPNRRIFELAQAQCPGASRYVMVGDNPQADVEGAEAAGIPGILVRGASARGATRWAPTLHEVPLLLEALD